MAAASGVGFRGRCSTSRSSRRGTSVESSSSSSGQSVKSQDDTPGSDTDVTFEEPHLAPKSKSLEDIVEELKRNELVKPQPGQKMEEAVSDLIADLTEHDQLNASMTSTYSKFARGDGELHGWHDIPFAETPDRVVFMFLVVQGLKNEAWWEDWFADADATGHQDHYSIVYHRGSAFGKDHDAISSDLLARKGIGVCPATKTGWARNGLARATILLLRFALEGARNQWFVLLSDTCMPIYTFHDLYRMLKRQKQSRFQDFGMTLDIAMHRNIWRSGRCTNNRCSHKAAQWSTWIRADAEWFVRENHLLRLKPLSTFVDEPYFINMMDEFERPYQDASTTYTRWYNVRDLTAEGVKKFVSSPHMFSRVTMERIKRARRRGCWFFRKVGPQAEYPRVEELMLAPEISCWVLFVSCLRAFVEKVVYVGHRFIFGPHGFFRRCCKFLTFVCVLLTRGFVNERARTEPANAGRAQIEQELALMNRGRT